MDELTGGPEAFALLVVVTEDWVCFNFDVIGMDKSAVSPAVANVAHEVATELSLSTLV
jgi:hypothetical protein